MADDSAEVPKYDQEQYDMLVRCSEKKDMSEWNDWRKTNTGQKILLAGVELYKGYLKEANLRKADLQGAKLEGANLQGAKLGMADLSKARLSEANLEWAELTHATLTGARLNRANLQRSVVHHAKLIKTQLYKAKLCNAGFRKSNLQSADFQHANLNEARIVECDLRGCWLNGAKLQSAEFHLNRVDGLTSITGCEFDEQTDFTGVGLDASTIDPGLKVALRDNIRRIHWKKWLAAGNWAIRALKNFFVRPFWWMTGYGSSTTAVIVWFLVSAFIFGNIYFALENGIDGIIQDLSVCGMPWYHTYLRAMYFSVVTMTTLGFGDMHALKTSYGGHVLLMVQVILGYVLLGALVTRLGILFTGEAPAAAPTPAKEKVLED